VSLPHTDRRQVLHHSPGVHSLWYRLPAVDWQSQALPIGNGRLGAMLFGQPDVERIQFNEQSLWGGLDNYDNALAGQSDDTFDTSMTGFGSYRAFGDVTLTFAARPGVSAPGGPCSSSATEGVEKTVDGTPSTKWCIEGPPAEVIWQAALAAPAAVPAEWADGSFSGLRARGGYAVSCTWRGGHVTDFTVVADRAATRATILVRVNGHDVRIRPRSPREQSTT